MEKQTGKTRWDCGAWNTPPPVTPKDKLVLWSIKKAACFSLPVWKKLDYADSDGPLTFLKKYFQLGYQGLPVKKNVICKIKSRYLEITYLVHSNWLGQIFSSLSVWWERQTTSI